jgi:hypothetical protein
MEALGGKFVREYYEDIFYKANIKKYIIDVDKSLEDNKEVYEQYVSDEKEDKMIKNLLKHDE